MPELSTGNPSQHRVEIIHNNFDSTTWNPTLHKNSNILRKPTFYCKKGQLSRTCTHCSFFTDPLTTCKRHLPCFQRHNTPDHDFEGYVTKYFTSYGQVLQVDTLHSDVLFQYLNYVSPWKHTSAEAYIF
jgi:hypothetical protein